jgi:hypothetical protein
VVDQAKHVACLDLHARFTESQQQGDFMVDIEGVYQSLDEYLTGGEYPVGSFAEVEEPHVEPQAEPQLFESANLAEMALQHVASLNGHEIHRAVRESELDGDVDVAEETNEERRQRYLDAEQGEVSDPDEWATIQYNHERMLAFAQANQLRLQNALTSLADRCAQAETQGNWEGAAMFTKAMEEIEALREIA